MARGDHQASGAEGQANANANTFMANSNALYSELAPTLQNEVAHPSGYNPSDLAAMQTEAAQTAGGGNASAVGQGGLFAARTGNKGAAGAAIPAGVRAANENQSQNLLGIQTANARLKEQQRQAGITGQQNLLSTEAPLEVKNLEAVAPLSEANTKSGGNWSWQSDILDPFLQTGEKALAGTIFGG